MYVKNSSGTTLAAFKSDGSVGIGTGTPAARLDVRGALGANGTAVVTSYFANVTSGATSSAIYIGASSGTDWKIGKNVTGITSNTNFSISDHANNRFLDINSNGNIGIGTTDPAFRLHVAGGDVRLTTYSNSVYFGSARLLGYDSSTAGNLWIIGGSGGASGSCRVTLGTVWSWDTSCDFHYAPGTYGAGTGILSIGQQVKNNTNFTHGITRFYTKGAEQVRINVDGNVGINTTSPSAKLHIQSDGSHDEGAEIVLRHANNNTTDIVSTLSFQNNGGQVAMIQAGTTGANNTGYISFFADSAGTSGERMRIQGNGYVGIGTATAYSPLQVYSSADQKILLSGSANPYIRWQNGGSNRAYIRWIEGGANSALTFVNSLSDNFDFLPHANTGALALRLRGNDSDVWGYVYAEEGSGAAHTVGFLDGDGAWAAQHVKDTSWDFRINNDSKMFINSNGSVGVGANSPNKTLEVRYVSTSTDVTAEGLGGGSAGKGLLIYNNNQSNNNVYANLDFRARNADGRIAYQYQTAANTGDFHFITDNTNSPQSMMTIKNDGEVRLVNKLLVQNSSSSSEINIYKSAGSNTDSAILRVGYDSASSFAISRQQGSSAIYLNSGQSGSTVYHQIASSTKMTVNATGVGVGTVSASGRLHVYRTADTVPGLLLGANRDGARVNFNYLGNTATLGEIGMTYYGGNGDCQIWMGANLNSNSSSHSGPTVGVAGTSASSWYTVWNTQTASDFYGIYRRAPSPSSSYENYFRIKSDGNVGINTTNPTDRLHVRSVQAAGYDGSNLATLSLETYNSNNSSYGSYVKCKNFGGGGGGPDWKIGGMEGYWTTNKVASIDFITGDDWYNPGNKDEGEIAFTVYNNTGSGSTAIEAMRIHQTGNIGIGSTNPGSRLTVNGSFSASSKSFLIDHPTKENKKLEHGCLEGPEFGVYHRGTTQSNTITLPDYWSGLVREGTVTVQLTPKGSFQHLYVVSQSLTEIVIGAAGGETINCFYTIYGERADIDSLVVEKDV